MTYNIKMDTRKLGYKSVDWIRSGKMIFCEHGRRPSGSMKTGNFLTA
jgi:hypothetical protein